MLRRWGLVVIAMAAFAGVAGLAAWFYLRAPSGPPVVLTSEAGGFVLTLPSGWELQDESEHDSPYVWAEAERRSRLGTVTGWAWVVRGAARGDDPLATHRDRALDDIRQQWGDVEVEIDPLVVDGRDTLRLRYEHPVVRALGFLPGADVHEVRHLVVNGDNVLEVGVAAWRRLPGDANDLLEVIDIVEPTGSRTIEDPLLGFAFDVPATWNQDVVEESDLPNAVAVATAPTEPARGWTILWRLDQSYEEAVAGDIVDASRDERLLDRTETTIDRRPATRVVFERPLDGGLGVASCSMWIVDGPDGRAWQLLVGSLRPDRATAEEVAGSFRFVTRRT